MLDNLMCERVHVGTRRRASAFPRLRACAEREVLLATAAVGAQRRAGYLMMFLLSVPRVIVSAGTNNPAVAMFVWSALALLFATRQPRIPKAIVRSPRTARARVWSDAALLRFGELPLSPYGHPPQLPWRLARVSPNPTLPEPARDPLGRHA